MKRVILCFLCLFVFGCVATKSISVNNNPLGKTEIGVVNILHSSKIIWEEIQKSVISLEKSQKAVDYVNISKDIFDDFDKLDSKIVDITEKLSKAVYDFSINKSDSNTISYYQNLLDTYYADMDKILRKLKILK